ncbi:peroxiredoxin [Scopulibacillus darangshiensis]|uniref:Peroxiredoxin n=1 Tax=Scopulibacillus darangshiensis TaxID=442528 RepID=A0A4V2SN36_9BACL|nr:TlpA disulfide reductase family protein [Scopulibacillus darangshiensis]TCP29746.1 peroxiredoxin [Scopulibacillus darangshiensis]
MANGKRKRSFLKIVVSLLLVAVMITVIYTVNHETLKSNTQVKEPRTRKNKGTEVTSFKSAPNFTLLNGENDKVTLADYKGQSILLTTWTTWCKECRAEMASLETIQRKIPQKWLRVLAVNMTSEETSVKSVEKYLNENPVSFTILFDKKGEVKEDYHIFGIPTSFLIDPYGKIIHTFRGVVSVKDVQDWLPQ